MKPIFISGPHGCGKTALINNLLMYKDKFVFDDYSIDFRNDLTTISAMTTYEECLFRLYHRFYTAKQAFLKCSKITDVKIMIVDRSIYDSIVYNKVEYDLGRITKIQYSMLAEISENSLKILKPYTVILNPKPELIVDYLKKRRESKERKDRDKLCAREDTLEYIRMMNTEYTNFYSKENILSINNNGNDGINKVCEWVKNEVLITK